MPRALLAATCCGLLSAWCLAPGPAVATGGDVLWVFQGIEDINAMTTLPDVNGDAVPDVVVETYDAGAVGDHLYLLSGGDSGTPAVIWSVRPHSGASDGGGYGDYCLARCGDLNGDGFPDVLLGTAWGNRSVHAVDGQTGAVIWTFDTYNEPDSGWVYSVVPHPDRTGDGVPEVIFGAGSDNDTGYMLNGASGLPLWRFYGTIDAISVVLSLPDVNSDGTADVLFCASDNDHRVYCVSGASSVVGSQIWYHDTGASNHAATLIDDVTGDGIADIVIGNWASTFQVQCLNSVTGLPVWSFNNGSYNYIMRLVTVSDMDGDLVSDVAVGSWDRAVRVVSGLTGQLIWESYGGTLNGGDFWAVERVDDVTGDGKDEVVGGSFDYNVYLFDGADGDTLWMHNTGNRLYTVRGAPDLSGNGTADVLAGTQFLSSGGRAFALEGADQVTGVGDVVQADGRAEIAASEPSVRLRWSCNEPYPFYVYRCEERVGRARGRLALIQAFNRGELRSRDVIQAILAEDESGAVLLTPNPVEAAGTGGRGWRYMFNDNLESQQDAGRFTYRLAALLPGGGETTVLELRPTAASLPVPLILSASVSPNPFNPAVKIRFELERPAHVSLAIWDARGCKVAAIPEEFYPAGAGEFSWLARDDAGRDLPSGAYFITLAADGESRHLRAVLVK